VEILVDITHNLKVYGTISNKCFTTEADKKLWR